MVRTLLCAVNTKKIMNNNSRRNPAQVALCGPIPRVATNAAKPQLLEFFQQHNASVYRRIGLDCSRSTYYKYHSVALHLERYLRELCDCSDLPLDAFDRDLLVVSLDITVLPS